MKYCKKCVMPNTKPDLFFDGDGVCIACRASEKKYKTIDWNERKKLFEEIINKYKSKNGKDYDCIVPVSGGKDSTYQVYVIKKIYKLNPLCVHFEPTYPSELGRKNLENLRNMDVDIISFKPNQKVYTKMCKEAFIRVGDHEWPNHVGIFTIPIRVAVKYNIPLIIWGENSQLEYGGPEQAAEKNLLNRNWLEEFGGLLGLRVSDWKEMGVSEEEMNSYTYPNETELNRVGIAGIFLGYYFFWDARRQVELIKKIGFNLRNEPVEGTYVDYENLDDEIVSIHDYFKYLKFGFGRATDHACLDIRNNRLNRKNALKLIEKYDGKVFPERVDMFCKRFDITRDEFFLVMERFANKSIFQVDENGKLNWKNGQLINKYFKKELEINAISEKDCENTINIEKEIQEKIKEQIKIQGYVNELIPPNHFNY